MTLFATARLTVRRYRSADLPAHLAMCADPAIRQWQGWARAGGADFDSFGLEPGRHALDSGGWLNHAVALTATGEVIGDCAIRVEGEEARLGLAILGTRRRQGLARELVEGAATFLASHGISRLIAEIDEANAASRGLFAALSFAVAATALDEDGPYVVMARVISPPSPRR